MADNTFRSFRRDTPVARGERSSPRDAASDPLAELARLIGQSDGRGGFRRDAGWQEERYDETSPAALDWGVGGEDYAGHGQAEESYAPPRSDESYHHQPADAFSWLRDRNYEEQSADARHYSHPVEGSDEAQSGRTEPAPFILPGHGSHFANPAEAADQDGDESEEHAVLPRRSGTVVVVAVLGLAVLGTAGALGYHAMFGGSVIPSLPPIIKPGDTPIKIVPKHESQAGTTNQADVDAKGTADQLVTHEEQPVNLQAANPAPRVVTTIPVISNAPDAPLPDGSPPLAPGPSDAASSAPVAPPLGYGESGNPALQFGATMPAQPTEPTPTSTPPGTKTVRTVTILPQQRPAIAPVDTAPDVRPARPREAPVRPPREPAERTASAGPLSIVPTRESGPPPRTRTAMTNASGPMALNSPAATGPVGGYAVQVTAQRSEAEALAAFRSLQARYPQQLGGRRVFVRRADLGARGVYYRALIGPFASADQATSLCSSLKAAGGTCLIQRN